MSSVFIMNDWFVNQDRTITFYDTKKFSEFANGKTKDVPSEEKQKVKNKQSGQVSFETVMVKKFEHVFNPKGCMLSVSTQITGYQLSRQGVKNGPSILVMALGRRLKENKKFLQSEEEIKIIFGLQDESTTDDMTTDDMPTQDMPTQDMPTQDMPLQSN
jgi:hypothetical protein